MDDEQDGADTHRVLAIINDHQEREASRQRQAAQNPHNGRFPPSYPAACAEWAKLDKWTLREAANLLAGCHPSRPDALPGHDRLNAVVAAMRTRLERAALKREGKIAKRYHAPEVLAWARKKNIAVPDALLAAFGCKTGAGSASDAPVHGNALRNAEKRERVLGAAVAALVHYPAQCKDRGGKVSGTQIARVLEQKATELFGPHGAPYSVDVMARHVNGYLKGHDS